MSEKKNFVLRINHASYKALEKWAADDFRSVNAQIEYLLDRALKEHRKTGADKDSDTYHDHDRDQHQGKKTEKPPE